MDPFAEIDFPSLRALVVDDDRLVRQLVAGYLDGLGVTDVQIAGDGDEALEALARRHFDLVLTDFEMSPINGVELVARLRREPDIINPFVAVVLMTAHTDRATVIRARDAGVNAFLAKPVGESELRKKLGLVLTDDRPFVRSRRYVGPDRRRRDLPVKGLERRRPN